MKNLQKLPKIHQVNVFNFRDGSRSHLVLSCFWLQFFFLLTFEIKIIVAKTSAKRQRISVRYRQGVTKRCRISWLTNMSPLVYEPKCGGRGELRGLSQWVQLDTGAQINFGDLTPYLTYGYRNHQRFMFHTHTIVVFGLVWFPSVAVPGIVYSCGSALRIL